jgi:hypothetical protein
VHDSGVTVCSVSFHNARHLELNWNVTSRLNPMQRLMWVVTANTPSDADDLATLGAGHFVVARGSAFDPGRPRPASYHHGIGLNTAMELVRTRFALILDPDFYIVRANWVADVIQHMQANGLAFLGVPWHPKWHTKYRYFPCVHCLFVDLTQVKAESLDFRPGPGGPGTEKPAWKALASASLKRRLPSSLLHVLQNLRGRMAIGASEDTGHYVYREYARSHTIRSECLTPVYRHASDYPVVSHRAFSRAIDGLLPDRFSYRPKRTGYFAESGFRELRNADARLHGWEEFIWKGQPFGFHLRRQQLVDREPEAEMATLAQVIANLTDVDVPAPSAMGR